MIFYLYFIVRVMILLSCGIFRLMAEEHRRYVNEEYMYGNLSHDMYLSKIKHINQYIVVIGSFAVFDIILLKKFYDCILLYIKEIKDIWIVLKK